VPRDSSKIGKKKTARSVRGKELNNHTVKVAVFPPKRAGRRKLEGGKRTVALRRKEQRAQRAAKRSKVTAVHLTQKASPPSSEASAPEERIVKGAIEGKKSKTFFMKRERTEEKSLSSGGYARRHGGPGPIPGKKKRNWLMFYRLIRKEPRSKKKIRRGNRRQHNAPRKGDRKS